MATIFFVITLGCVAYTSFQFGKWLARRWYSNKDKSE